MHRFNLRRKGQGQHAVAPVLHRAQHREVGRQRVEEVSGKERLGVVPAGLQGVIGIRMRALQELDRANHDVPSKPGF